MSKRTRRTGFSLVELLTVAAIVGILLAITIPAIQSAREAARGLQCKNNLKQIGLALHNYCESYGRFPSGWIGVDAAGHPEVSGPTGWGWAAMILPQLDQEDLFSSINFRAPILDESNVMAQRTGPAIYRCPSDPAPDECTFLTADASGVLATLPRANYVGNFGSGSVAYCQNLVGLGTQCDAGSNKGESGIFYHNSGVKFASILDGTSHTILVSERAAKQDATSGNCATWVGVVPGALSAYSRNLGSVLYIPSLAISHGAGFTSVHPGMVQMLMADGHVRAVSKTTSYDVLLAMASRDAGDDFNNYQVHSFHFGVFPAPNVDQAAVGAKSDDSAIADASAAASTVNECTTCRSGLSRVSHPIQLTRKRSFLTAAVMQPPLLIAPRASFWDYLAHGLLSGARGGVLPLPAFSVGAKSFFLPHHTGGDPNEEQHYLIPFPDGTHASWGGFTPDSVGPLTIKYDFRPLLGSPNNITAGQKARTVDALKAWADGTCGKLVFVQDSTASDDEVIIIGTGDIGIAGCGNDPAILGCGGGSLVDHTIFAGEAWQNESAAWDEVFGNGNPPDTFDYFTVVAQEVGHALGLGHVDDVGGFGCCGTNIMNGIYGGEQTSLSDMDVSHIQSLYGDECGGGPRPGPGGLPPGWIKAK